MSRTSAASGEGARRWRAAVAQLVAIACSVLACFGAIAAQERYDYDPLGRLVRMVDGQGRVTEYVYDAVGNLLEVRSGGAALAPTVADISPATLRRGGSALITVNGANLSNVGVSAADPQLQISGVTSTATRLTFSLSAGLGAALGASPIVLRNAAGEVTRSITIQPTLPVLAVVPTPLAIPPDNVARGFAVTLDHVDVVDHTVSVSSDQPAIAVVTPASAVIPAGQTQATFQVRGVAGGQTIIRLTSPTLAAAAIPVFVTAEFRGISTAYTSIVGIELAAGPTPPGTPTNLFSKPVGIALGPVWVNSSPRGLIAGTSGTLAINGSGLPAGLTVAAAPADGITLGAPVVNAGGTQATVSVTVAANAALGARLLTVQAGGQTFVVATPGADRFDVLRATPEIISIVPLFGTAGTTINPFVVRGRNLFDAQGLSFSGAGIVVGTQPVVNDLGTELTTAIEISAVAAAGARTVTVITPSGTSASTTSSANTFSVVETVADTYSNLVSPAVGVDLASASTPTNPSVGLLSSLVGVSVGSIVNSVAPATGATGQSLSIVLTGRELAGVSSVSIAPSTGVSLGTPVIAGDGSSIQVPVNITADAPLGARRLQLLAGTTPVPFAAPGGDRFDVTAPVPVLVSIEPIVAQVGTTVGFVLRGSNLQGATQIRVTPSQGVAVNPPGVNAAGDIASVVMVFDAAAAAGQRVVSVVTPAGESSTVSGPTNTITLSSTAGTTYPSIMSPLVGVELASSVTPPIASQSLYSSLVGIDVATAPPAAGSIGLYSTPVGVAVGPVAANVEPLGFNPGNSGSVIVRGIGLPATTTLAFVPATGVTFSGAPVVAADGSSVTQAITIAADAPQTARGIQLSAGGTPIPSASGAEMTIAIGPGAPDIVSLATILARQGETLSLVIRGSNFRDVVEVLAEPASGMTFGTSPTVAADGSQVTVGVSIAADAPLGGRVIRVRTRSGITTSVAAPANTFTVFPP
jgi:YD repeat-containing protein